MDLYAYKEDPCRYSSLPWHKLQNLVLPEGIQVVHAEEWDDRDTSEPYFRLIHRLKDIPSISLSDEYSLQKIRTTEEAELLELSEMVARCYPKERLPLPQLKTMIQSPLFHPDLWIAIRDLQGELVASCLSEFNRTVPEGSVEWLQVLPEHRGQGFGRVLLSRTLRFFQHQVDFVTVSGRVRNPSSPEKLYRRCGFEGHDIWHICKAPLL